MSDANDAQILAIIDVHSALLTAMCATHPEPEKLLKCFEGTVEQQLSVSDGVPEVGGFHQSWVETVLRILRECVAAQRGRSPGPSRE